MNERAKVVGEPLRAKALRPSDARFRLHALDSVPANDGSLEGAPSPAQARSDRRAAMAKALAAMARNALVADGLSYADAAAACDRQKQHVGEMMTGDRTMTAADLVMMARSCPSLQAAVIDLWRTK